MPISQGKKHSTCQIIHNVCGGPYFVIWKAKTVYTKTFIIAFDGKVSAQVDYGNRIAPSRNGAFAAI